MSFTDTRARFLCTLTLVVILSTLLSVFSIRLSRAAQADRQAQQESRDFELLRRGLDGDKASAGARYDEARARVCKMAQQSPASEGWVALGPFESASQNAAISSPCDQQRDADGMGVVKGAVYPDGAAWLVSANGRGVMIGKKVSESVEWRRLREDGGQTFTAANIGIDDTGLPVAPFVMDPTEPQRLWTGGRALWRTVDGAGQWAQASAFTAGSPEARVSAIAVAPSNFNRVVAGSSEGLIHRSDRALSVDATAPWLYAQPRDGFVSSIAFDPEDENIVYATYSSFGGAHVWRSVDGGASWTAIDGAGETGLPDLPVHSIVVDPGNRARLFIGTDLGIFVTIDGGQSWKWENAGFGLAAVESLVLNRAGDVASLFAFTSGAGVWQMNLNAGQPADQSPDQTCEYTLSSNAQSFNATAGEGSVDVTACSSGRQSSGVVSAADRYTFAATAGQSILIGAVSSTDRFTPYLYLTDSNGVTLAQNYRRLTVNGDFLIIPASGNYFIELIGTDGFSTSSPRNGDYALTVFAPPTGCGFTLGSTLLGFESSGGAGSVNITTGSTCAWYAVSNHDWITLGAATSVGSGKLNLTVASNPTTRVRRGSIVIAGQTVVIEQAGTGGSCAETKMTPGQTVSGALSEGDCQARYRSNLSVSYADRYSFTGKAGEQVAFELRGEGNQGLTLAGPAGRSIAEAGTRLPASGFFALPADGDYVIEVFNTSPFGKYQLTFAARRRSASPDRPLS